MRLKKRGYKQITIRLAANINPINIGYMKSVLSFVNEQSI